MNMASKTTKQAVEGRGNQILISLLLSSITLFYPKIWPPRLLPHSFAREAAVGPFRCFVIISLGLSLHQFGNHSMESIASV